MDQNRAPQAIFPTGGAAPIGPYTPVVIGGGFAYTSGQVAIQADGTLVMDSIDAETRQVMANLKRVLAAAGCSFRDVVKTNIYITDMAYFKEVNEAYGSFLEAGHFPARDTVQVSGLPLNVRVEISMVAVVPQQA